MTYTINIHNPIEHVPKGPYQFATVLIDFVDVAKNVEEKNPSHLLLIEDDGCFVLLAQASQALIQHLHKKPGYHPLIHWPPVVLTLISQILDDTDEIEPKHLADRLRLERNW